MLFDNEPNTDDNKDDGDNHDDDIMITYVDWGARESGERGAKQQFPLLKGKAAEVKHLTRCCTSLVLSMKVQHVSST